MGASFDWGYGFAGRPERRNAPKGGLLLYRAWGASSSEWGSGYFSTEKPASVLDAEMRFNIADWGNGIHFVSTFRLKEGFPYYIGHVAHGHDDLSKPAMQVFLSSPFVIMIELVKSMEKLTHDAFVVQPTKPGAVIKRGNA